ncbi:hypothetical protein JCM16303_003731 [Sporobolomyces ruberrimus]
MNVMRDWNEIKELLESDKIKRRAEGISRCREFLSVKRNFKALNENHNHSWLETLQTLFHIVIIERNASVSKKTATTDKRLDEAAQMVRWLANKVNRYLSRKVVKALINHLTQMIAINGKLQAYALTYAKALRTVLAYPPHLEHLDERQWTDITMLCFSAVLGDKIKVGQNFSDLEAMDLDGDDEPNQRRGLDEGDDNSTQPIVPKQTANALEIELVGCLEVVFRSSSSPFVTHAQAILRKFLRFFRLFPSETTAHLAALVALNRALSELELNDQCSMRQLGPHVWPHILAHWSTKNALLKEQIIVSLRYLFPFVIPRQHPHRSTNEPSVIERAKALYEAVLTEPTIRWRESFVMDIDHLSLGIEEEKRSGVRAAFTATTFRIGGGFDEKDAVAWCIAELGADALARVYEVVDAAGTRPHDGEISEAARGKRRKIEDPLSLLLDSIADPTQPSNISIARVQILLFLVDRYWQSLDDEASRRIVATVVQLLSAPLDAQLQCWNLLVVAAISRNRLPSIVGPLASPNQPTDLGVQLWTLVLRKVSVVENCRAACHAANVLLAFERVSGPALVDALDTFARELEIQGPNFPSDSVCLFLEWCLAIAATDSQLFRLRFPDKLLGWLTSSWRPLEGLSRSHSFGQPRPHADPLSPSSLVLLIARLSGSPVVPDFVDPCHVPDCAVGTQAMEIAETAKIRDFVDARVPTYAKEGPSVRSPFTLFRGSSEGIEATRARRISAWLAKTLDVLLQEGGGGGETYWTNMSAEMARRHLDLATVTLSVEGLFSLSTSTSERSQNPTLRTANAVVTRLAPTLALKKWQPTERAQLLEGLDLIFAPIKHFDDIEYPVFLEAGPASDVPLASVPPRETSQPGNDLDSPRFLLLRAIWSMAGTGEILAELLTALRFILDAVVGNDSSATPPGTSSEHEGTQASQRLKELEATQKNDGFGGDHKSTNRTTQSIGASSAHRAAQAYMAMCIRGFVTCEMATSGSTGPARLAEVIEMLTSAEGEDGILIAEQAFKTVRSGLVHFGLAQCHSILTYFGNDLLSTYRYARDERFHLVALRFLYCVSPTWVRAEDATEEFGIFARQLCAFYINGLRKKVTSSWKIRLQILVLFDEYLRIDPTLHYWKVGSALVISDDGVVISPNNIIPFMLADVDFRVRFRASSSAPRLFQLYYEIGLPEQPLFEDIRSKVTFDLAETEQVLTQVLAHANIMIASAARRRGPYSLLLDIATQNADLREATVASLTAVAQRLGLQSLATLYLEYARYLLWTRLSANKLMELPRGQQIGSDIVQQLPFRATGFRNLREARQADFASTASFLLQNEHTQEAFETLCAVAKISPVEGRLACLAETVALALILDRVKHTLDSTLPATVLGDVLHPLAEGAGAGDAHLADVLLSSIADDVVVAILIEMFQQRWPHDQPLPALEEHDRKAAETFQDILQLSADLAFDHETRPPFWRPEESVAAAIAFSKDYPVFNEPGAILSVVHKLLDKIRCTPFLGRKQSGLLSLAVALALGHRTVNEAAILEALGGGLVDLLPIANLRPLVVPMLTWSIDRWFTCVAAVPSKHQDHRALSEQLVRAAHTSAKLREAKGPHAKLDKFDTFLDGALRTLCGLKEETATEACILWPRVVVETSKLPASEIYHALASPFAPISKFAFVQTLRGREDILAGPESGRTMWRFAQAIQQSEEPSAADSLAFAELLFDSGGRIEAPGVVELSHDERASDDYEPPTDSEGAIQRLLLRHVLRLFKHRDRTVVSSAFKAAKNMMSVPSAREHLAPAHFELPLRPLVSLLSHPSLLRPQYVRTRTPRSLGELSRPEWLERAQAHDLWVREFAELLCEVRAESDAVYAQLVPLVNLNPTFAGTILPNLVHSLLLEAINSGRPDVSTAISRHFESLLGAKTSSPVTVSAVVRVASRLRRHPRTDNLVKAASRYDCWLDVPWLDLASGAVQTGSYLDALLFLELAREYNGLFTEQGGRVRDPRSADRAQSLLYRIFSNIDEPDGFYARESSDVREALVSRYRHEGRWTDAFGLYGAQHEAQTRRAGTVDRASTAGVVSSLASFGFNRLALSILQPARLEGSLQEDDLPSELPYELAWKTGVWDLPIEHRAAQTSSVSLYSALRASRAEHSTETAYQAIDLSLSTEVNKFSTVGLDLPSPDSSVVSTILALREVRNLVGLRQINSGSDGRIKSLEIVPSKIPFDQAERILSTRISRLRTVRLQEQQEAVGDAFNSPIYSIVRDSERSCLIGLSRAAREAGQLQISLNAVTTAHTLVEDTESLEVDRELAHVLWDQGEHTAAIALLDKVNRRSEEKDAMIWATLGVWIGDARLRSPSQVIQDCFDPAVAALVPTSKPQDRAYVFQAFATFADEQYQELSRSTEEQHIRVEAYAERKTLEFTKMQDQRQYNSGGSPLDSENLVKSKGDAEAHIREDRRIVGEAKQTTRNMLQRAVENYARALAESDESNDRIYRFCALWLAHSDDEDLHRGLKPLLSAIPSYKFVFLAYQLSARLSLSSSTSKSADNVRRLVRRLCKDHPFHAFFPIHALRDGPIAGKGSRRSSSTPRTDVSKSSRAQAAAEVIEEAKSDEQLRGRIASLDLACEAYGEWAAYKIKESQHYADSRGTIKKGPLVILPSMKIRTKLKNQAIPVSTYNLPIDPTGRYPDSSFPSIVAYDQQFDVAGGLHVPKIVKCLGSDGQRYRQLLKGDDEVRQDAVMEQTFDLVNTILSRDVDTRRRRLQIRTYKVIPLQGSNGLIEFVANTSPLGSCLQRLYDELLPGLPKIARETMRQLEGAAKKSDPKVLKQLKLESFTKTLEKMPPLMRHLFWKRQKVPSLWFEMRLNYSRSVATTSMIGHVLGLGDRHVSNILIDEATGELVHIDFGIAFEQGKRLAIPELVPFRLTQNLVDGFGSSGIDGVFRRCSEETLRVLRERSNILMTILEVFKHDPLQRWAVSTEMAKRVQGGQADDKLKDLPDDADRALSIVRSKLDTRLGVQYSVNQVIQEATDPRNLSCIFSGWQPYY